ncbi:coiled-coil domain-containing protein 18 isoform X8 [Carica papaya]|uniref:coiled-coil domain-containing protein 18 isoform X8 n=1 Tax=Carica papaya TaxID=3649 RepID=UPI000B8CAEEE|nr:coiled-coil domain-containing protein 18 isoform X8 [Carica papaya]
MDDDKKKKKRNKKKKNKLIEATDVALSGGETASVNESSVTGGRNAMNGNVQDTEMDMDGHHQLSGTEGRISEQLKNETDSYRQEVDLEERIKQLEMENDVHLKNEAILDETTKRLQEKNDLYMKKEVALEERIKQLEMENDVHLKKEAILEETITGLRNENASCMQKEAILEDTIIKLQNQNSLHIQKEAGLEENISQLLEEIATLQLKELASKETNARLNDDITTLQMQVVELEESKNDLSKENQQLIENVKRLQMELQSLDKSISSAHSAYEPRKAASKEELNSQIEAACVLVEKLITENAELVEKVNELCIKINKQSMSAMLSSSTEGPDPQLGMAESERAADHMSIPNGNMYVPGQELESVEDAFVQHEKIDDSKNVEVADMSSNPSEGESGEIVHIMSDANEVQVLESEAVEREKQAAVALSDAPLIGAPFRLVSFVAKYVSGADLAAKNSLDKSVNLS